MKKLLLIMFLFPILGFPQQQPERWYFGFHAGLDFSGGTPTVITNSAINQWEGNATACDSAGNLDFYTDGISVWNANNALMPNGTGLLGDFSSTHSATIVPVPNDPEKYYLFTNSDIFSSNGFRYSIVDMTLNGGLGDVTAVKNVLLLDSVTEECVAVPGSNGCGTWIITRHFDAIWYAYLIDSSGIQPPAISYTGSSCVISEGGGVGYLKASPLNNQIAYAKYGYNGSDSFFELYDFNNSTGELSNPFELHLDISVYGCSFSPDGSRFYGAEWDKHLYQYDLTLGSTTDIANSKTLVGTTGYFTSIGDLQIGPDEKIYATVNNAAYLAVINDPNVLGTACNFVENGVWLGGNICGIGLPATLIFSSCSNSNNVQSAFASNDTTLCQKFCIDFFDQSQNNPVAWQWFFQGGDPSSSTDQDPFNICYDSAGLFAVTLVTTGSNGFNDTLTLDNFINVYANPFPPVITQSGNVLTSSPAFTYQWQLNSADIPGATNQDFTITQSGLYTVIITNENGCSAKTSIDASIVGISEITNGVITISPNPSDGNFIIRLLNDSGTDIAIEVSNTIGQCIFSSSEKVSSRDWKKNIDLSDQPKGVYFISTQTDQAAFTSKVMIIK